MRCHLSLESGAVSIIMISVSFKVFKIARLHANVYTNVAETWTILVKEVSKTKRKVEGTLTNCSSMGKNLWPTTSSENNLSANQSDICYANSLFKEWEKITSGKPRPLPPPNPAAATLTKISSALRLCNKNFTSENSNYMFSWKFLTLPVYKFFPDVHIYMKGFYITFLKSYIALVLPLKLEFRYELRCRKDSIFLALYGAFGTLCLQFCFILLFKCSHVYKWVLFNTFT